MRGPSRQPTQPMDCVAVVTPQPFVFPACPTNQSTFQVTEDRSERRPIKSTEVIHQPANGRIAEPRDVCQALVIRGGSQPLIPHRGLDRCGGLLANRRQEAEKELPPTILGPPRPKGVAQEV